MLAQIYQMVTASEVKKNVTASVMYQYKIEGDT